jgi:hypothetical protein
MNTNHGPESESGSADCCVVTEVQRRELQKLVEDLSAIATRMEDLAIDLDEEGATRALLDCVDLDYFRPALQALSALVGLVEVPESGPEGQSLKLVSG